MQQLKNSIFFLFVTSFLFGNQPNEQFINLQEYSNQQNISNTRIQDAQIFLENQEKFNEIKRTKNQPNPTNINTNTSTESIAQNNYEFVPIDAIVLDAGHGGKHPGGVSNGIEEKRLTFTLLKKVHTLFRKKNKQIKIYVTRKNDNYVSLEDRVSKTARWASKKNVLFISIHGNIAYNQRVEGLEIYTLSDRASDPDALATERIENAGFSSEDIEKTDSLYSILADLIRDSTRKQSEWLARYVYDDMLFSTKAYGRGLKRANFFVLKYNTVPSILIEVGFMSNPAEATKLKSEEYQNKIAIGVYKGILRYIEEYNKTEGFVK